LFLFFSFFPSAKANTALESESQVSTEMSELSEEELVTEDKSRYLVYESEISEESPAAACESEIPEKDKTESSEFTAKDIFELIDFLNINSMSDEQLEKILLFSINHLDDLKMIYAENKFALHSILEQEILCAAYTKQLKTYIIGFWDTNDNDSGWNEKVFEIMCFAFRTFYYYPEDLAAAKEILPKEKFQEIYEIHQQMNSFPEGYAKEDYD
jgi:hypothetical protein